MLSYCQRHLYSPTPCIMLGAGVGASLCLQLHETKVLRPVRELSFHYGVITIAYHLGKSPSATNPEILIPDFL